MEKQREDLFVMATSAKCDDVYRRMTGNNYISDDEAIDLIEEFKHCYRIFTQYSLEEEPASLKIGHGVYYDRQKERRRIRKRYSR